MDTLSIFKFWKTNKSKIAVAIDGDGDGDTVADSAFSDPLADFSDDDDESFFELELSLPKFNPKPSQLTQINLNTEITEPKNNSKPQSPISILRSASPKLRIFMFGKLNKKLKNEDNFSENDSVLSCFSPKSNNSSSFTVKFKIEDGSIVPKFTRTNSENQLLNPKNESKRFSKEVVQKYLNFVKPLYTKKSSGGGGGGGGGERFPGSCSPRRTSSSSASASFPSPLKEKQMNGGGGRFKVKTKQLGKSKSASAINISPTPVRNDHPCDGIEGAILHCKRSLDSNRGYSSLSRCSSDPSHEKSIIVSEEQL